MSTLTPQAQADTSVRHLDVIRRLAWALAAATFSLMVLGATVRVMDAGLACPDWPLCHGQWFPPFDPVLSDDGLGPIPTPAQMNAEWYHRLLAAMVSFGLLALAPLAVRSRSRRIRNLTVVSGALLFTQVLLGAATVLLGNIHYSVAIHLAFATAFLLTLIYIARAASPARSEGDDRQEVARPPKLVGFNQAALVLLFAQLMVGAAIATTPGADLVCPSFPHCGRPDYDGVGALVHLQMTHRVLGLAFLAASGIAIWLARGVRGERRWAMLVAGLTTAQVVIGVFNVYLHVPHALSVTHLGVAVLIFVSLFNWTVRIRPVAAGE